MMDDALNMELKGVDNMNMLQHTDFFIWADGIEPTQIDKVTATPDVLPTVANLLGLDTTGAFLVGHDGLGDQGGYVFFADAAVENAILGIKEEAARLKILGNY